MTIIFGFNLFSKNYAKYIADENPLQITGKIYNQDARLNYLSFVTSVGTWSDVRKGGIVWKILDPVGI